MNEHDELDAITAAPGEIRLGGRQPGAKPPKAKPLAGRIAVAADEILLTFEFSDAELCWE